MLPSFKIQVQLHIKGRNGPSEVVMVVDGVKDLHHEHLLVHDAIYDYFFHPRLDGTSLPPHLAYHQSVMC